MTNGMDEIRDVPVQPLVPVGKALPFGKPGKPEGQCFHGSPPRDFQLSPRTDTGFLEWLLLREGLLSCVPQACPEFVTDTLHNILSKGATCFSPSLLTEVSGHVHHLLSRDNTVPAGWWHPITTTQVM